MPLRNIGWLTVAEPTTSPYLGLLKNPEPVKGASKVVEHAITHEITEYRYIGAGLWIRSDYYKDNG